MTSWTRATTIANTLEDRYGLEQWAKRNVAFGLSRRPDLIAQAQTTNLDDRDTLRKVVESAEETAGAHSAANLGIALHRLTERSDRGELDDVPPDWQPHLLAYHHTMTAAGIETVDPFWVERVIIVDHLNIAGTIDRLWTHPDWEYPRIGDVKTGSNALKYGATDIAVQLAIYAGATHAWKGDSDDIKRDRFGRYVLPKPDEEPDAYLPMPTVDRTVAMVAHMPSQPDNNEPPVCTLHTINIGEARAAVSKALWVRDWRKRKDLVDEYDIGGAAPSN